MLLAIVVHALLLAAAGTEASPREHVQFGLRLGPTVAMFWSDDRLVLEGAQKRVLQVRGGLIREVWPGPVKGIYSIWTTRGLGLLLGDREQIFGQVGGQDSILRSPAPEVLYVATRVPGPPVQTAVYEIRAGMTGREVARLDGSVVDFDASERGLFVFLRPSGEMQLVGGSREPIEIPGPADRHDMPTRVFLSGGQQYLVRLSESAFCQLTRRQGESWSCSGFDPSVSAVVRNVVGGTVSLEARVSPK